MKEKCRQIKAGALNFRVFDEGSGEPVLLLHGFPDNLLMWEDVANDLLSRGYRVIAFDQRGFGKTDMPKGRRHYTAQLIAGDIPLLLNALDVKTPVNIISHDWGAVIGWCAAMFHPERVKSLVVASVGHPQSYGKAGVYQKFIKGFYTLWFQLKYIAEFYLLNGGMKRWCASHPDYPGVMEAMSKPGRLTAAINWYRANFISILLKSWPRCTVPTLGIWSSQDRFLTEAQMTKSARYMDAPWAYRRLDAAGHWIPYEHPKTLVNWACNWFENKTAKQTA
jgi:pimeloyl-ACP methyl ester carboxylesterase